MVENSLIDFDVINAKNVKINEISEKLKSEFVGIDEQIDSIMSNIRSWYTFPELQSSPLIINLWGLTGVGKTSLVRAIAKYLDVERDMAYFNFADIGEQTSYEIEQDIEEKLSNNKPNRLFIYDEFQYASTLDSHGGEKDNKSGLKPFWELLDTGVLHKRFNYWKIEKLTKCKTYLEKIDALTPIVIENGAWVNIVDCLSPFKDIELARFAYFISMPSKIDLDGHVKYSAKYHSYSNYIESPVSENGPFGFPLKSDMIDEIIELAMMCGVMKIDEVDIYNRIYTMSYSELHSLIENVISAASKGYDLNFSESVMFVLGNLDEAYSMSFDVDPDMSPDQFHAVTKKINIVDVKKALQKRFRNEQIARLGNIHIIYPSFSSKSFKAIIDMELGKFAEQIKTLSGFEVTYDKSMKELIYNESVFPTHGTRPIFSTIHEMVKTKLPVIISNIFSDGLDGVRSINYGSSRGKTVVSLYDAENNLIKKYSYQENLRVDTLRDSTKDEEQALTAVHESGHFIVYAKLYGKLPEKVCSKTVSNETGGFLMEECDTKKTFMTSDDILNKIKVLLGGYAAERLIFEPGRVSSGASSDLKRATVLASKYVREFGMDGLVYVTTYCRDSMSTDGGNVLNEDDQTYINEKIRAVVNKCFDEAYKILNTRQWNKMLKKSAKYLADSSTMPKAKMAELFDEVKGDANIDGGSYYRDIVSRF